MRSGLLANSFVTSVSESDDGYLVEVSLAPGLPIYLQRLGTGYSDADQDRFWWCVIKWSVSKYRSFSCISDFETECVEMTIDAAAGE